MSLNFNRKRLAVGTAVLLALAATPVAGYAQSLYDFDLPAQPLADSLRAIGSKSGVNVVFAPSSVGSKTAPAVHGSFSPQQALDRVLAGSGLGVHPTAGGSLVVESGGPQDAGAQDEPPAAAGVIVTGTHIKGQLQTPSQVRVIGRQQIEQTGLTTVTALMADVTENTGAGISPATLSVGLAGQNGQNNRGYATSVNLRGLGPDATLTLLNGHRLPLASQGFSVDLAIIPLTAVDHVDILKDGASAIYGADAVAGVVNFITRNSFDGAETSVDAGSVTNGGKQDYQVSQLLGHRWASGDLMVDYTYDNQGALSTADRTISAQATRPNNLVQPMVSNSLYANVRQDLVGNLSLDADLLYSNRIIVGEGTGLNQGVPLTGMGRSSNDGLITTAKLRYDFLKDWSVAATGLYSAGDTSDHSEDRIDGSFSNSYRSNDYSIDIDASGSLLTLPTGAVKAALGGSYRQETMAAHGDADNFRLGREIVGLYGELSVPLIGDQIQAPGIRKLEFDASVRYDRYSDFGPTTNPKFDLSWTPVDGLHVHATYSTAFRAPELAELTQANQNILIELPDPLSPTGSSLTLARQGGNPDLRPETSRNFTVGFDWTSPDRNLRVSLDYYDIVFSNLIATPGGSDIFIELQPTVYHAFLVRSPSPVTGPLIAGSNFFNLFGPFTPSDIQLLLDVRTHNISALSTSGLDANIDYRWSLGSADMSSGVDLTYITQYREAPVSGQAPISLLNTVYNPADLKLRAHLGWSQGPWSATAFVNYINGYADNRTVGATTPAPAWTTADLQLAYRSAAQSGPFTGASIAVSVQNLLDAEPPFVRNPAPSNATNWNINYDPVNASALGRFVSVRLTKRW